MTTRSQSIRKAAILGAATAAMMMAAAPAWANVFTLTYSGTVQGGVYAGNTVSGNLIVDTGTNGIPGEVTSLSGTVTTGSGASYSVSLLPVNSYWGNDNTIGTGVWPPAGILDNPGLAFTTGGANPIWINIYSYPTTADATQGAPGAYDYWESSPGLGSQQDIIASAYPATVTLTSAPGPLPGAGFVGFAFLVLAGVAAKAREIGGFFGRGKASA